MIRVGSIEEIPQPARDRIKAKVMRRFVEHLNDRPEISDETLRAALGFDRTTLEAMYAGLSERDAERGAQARVSAGRNGLSHASAARPLVAGVSAAQAPMAASLGGAANDATPAQAGCCRRAAVRD
ncbi:hypothetical protein ACTZWW_20630 [Salinarimonas sp. NSM]|uniref:hypothetical protein n=1 Tax=Salinarimonas sp. NSM TaxID=3458003 RepID=UPI0040358744